MQLVLFVHPALLMPLPNRMQLVLLVHSALLMPLPNRMQLVLFVHPALLMSPAILPNHMQLIFPVLTLYLSFESQRSPSICWYRTFQIFNPTKTITPSVFLNVS